MKLADRMNGYNKSLSTDKFDDICNHVTLLKAGCDDKLTCRAMVEDHVLDMVFADAIAYNKLLQAEKNLKEKG